VSRLVGSEMCIRDRASTTAIIRTTTTIIHTTTTIICTTTTIIRADRIRPVW
jgi:hypothetical protein